MPYEVRKSDNKYCVYNTETNDNKGCSPTRAEAIAHLKALYAAEPGNSHSITDDAVFNLKRALELQSALIDGTIVLSEEAEEELTMYLEEALAALEEFATLTDEPEIIEETLSEIETDTEDFADDETFEEFAWEGPIVFENVSTGDNRIFKSDSINWEADTLPWSFRWQKSSGQGHVGSVPVGRVDRLERMSDGSIHGYGVVIPALSDEASEYLKLLKTGVGGGVSVDGDSAQFDVLENAEGQPRVEFSSMRLRALSAVDIPAFNGARIHLIEPDKYPVTAQPGVLSTEDQDILHSLEEVQEVISDIEEASTDSEDLVETILEDSKVILEDSKIAEDGKFFRTKDSEGWKVSNSLVAAAIPVLPTVEAFVEPEFSGPTPLTITKDGKVFGHLALFNTCHIGFPGTCVKPPKGSKYQYFHTGQIETAEGDLVDVGHLTFNTGHAGMKDNPKQAAEHYDNTGTVAADVRAGEDKFGIWVVGALRSHLTDEDIRAFRAAPLSGDWRRIAGKLELVGALAVNVPGFPIPRAKALVASGETETLFTFLEEDDEEFADSGDSSEPIEPVEESVDTYELQLRNDKKFSLAQRLGIKAKTEPEVSEEIEGLDFYELQLRLDKKTALIGRMNQDYSEFAQSLTDFLAEKDGPEPTEDNLPEELPELPNAPTKADVTKIAKNYTQSELLHDLQDLRDLLDDPEEKISAKDRKNLEALYSLFITTDKTGARVTANGENLEEFYNHCHGKGGKFCPTGGRSGGGGGGVTGRHELPGNPHEPGKAGREAGHSEHRHVTKTGSKPSGGKPSGGKPGDKGGFDKSSHDREQAVRQLSAYRKAKISVRRWATTSAIASAATLAIRGGLPLIKLVGPISPLLASPAVLTGLVGLGLYHAGRQLIAAKNHKRDFSSTIDRINKRQKIDEQIRRLNATKP